MITLNLISHDTLLGRGWTPELIEENLMDYYVDEVYYADADTAYLVEQVKSITHKPYACDITFTST